MQTAPFLPPAGQKRRVTGLVGSGDSWLLAQLAADRRPLVVLTAEANQAQRLAEELRWFAPERPVHVLPDWETLPYDAFSPHQDLVSERLATLWQIHRRETDVIVVPVVTALGQLPPLEYLSAFTFFLKQKQKLDVDKLREQMTFAGYQHVAQVLSPGEFSVRGGLVDLFPMGSTLPYRVDLFDDDIETIRTFDVDTQRSIYPVKEIRLLPAREFPLDDAGRATFRKNFRDRFEGDPSKSQIYKDISQGLIPNGIEYYLPLFFEQTATLFDYLPSDATICLHHDVPGAVDQFWRDTQSRYELLRGDRNRPLLPPGDLFMPADAFFASTASHPQIELQPAGDSTRHVVPAPLAALPNLRIDRRNEFPLAALEHFLRQSTCPVLLLADSLGRRETLLDLLREYGLQAVAVDDFATFVLQQPKFAIGVGPVLAGFAATEQPFALITESEMYATVTRARESRQSRKAGSDSMLRDLTEVKVGDPVVHEHHGIGRYLGLVKLDLGEGETEFLHLEYDGADKLYVPVSHLHLISRYSGAAPEHAPLHRLGSGQWEKAKRRAAQQVRDTAAELLNLYAQRAARSGHAFGLAAQEYARFREGFGFDETPDQAAAISAVLADMQAARPMDRLVCGDVGFGKTEVALRAAFVAVLEGRQVAVLVPTTLLAEQHYNTFCDRFADWPVKIAELSRFRSAKEQTEALKGVAEGRIDIIIGTHRLIQPDVKFKQLGLVIIDEEHRFGVRQKEELKKLRAEVDILTLTATPIPRTLAMAMDGLREFSVIATAPNRRLSIKTFVNRHSPGIIREAVLRELKRGGQVFFLHNEVETIATIATKLQELLPEARIAVAHGQMRERELEQVMREFYQQKFNILLCTTIIETGIDVPTANTIIINRADRFGLAQLHQLRGRVGRSHHQAYAYLLTPEEESLSAQAKKRLEAIQMMEDLGAGFYLAMHDLEIRGAGEVLGDSQSGQIQEIGFNLYTQMLNAAVRALKKGLEPDLAAPLGVTTEINLHSPALLPTDYCPDTHERLTIYKRLANCEAVDELDEMQTELVDRFGLLPDSAKTLLESHRIRLLGKDLGIAKIDAGPSALVVQFEPNPPIDPMRIIQLIQTKRNYKLAGPDKLRVDGDLPTAAVRAVRIKELFKELRK